MPDWNAIWKSIDARIQRAVGRVRVASRGAVRGSTTTTMAPELDLEVLEDEVVDAVELFQHAGFRCVPPADAEVIVVHVGAGRGHMVVIATADRNTAPTDQVAGDSAIYSTSATQSRVLCKADGTVEITSSSGGKVTLDGSGNILLGDGASDFVALSSKVTTEIDTLRSELLTHTHQYVPGASGSANTTVVSGIGATSSSVAADTVKAL